MARNRDPHQRPSADDRRFFDAIVFWRSVYAERGPQDSVAVISVAQMMEGVAREVGTTRTATPPA